VSGIDDNNRVRRLAAMAWWALPALFFVGVAVLHPFRDVVELDPDEGNNLVKALLLAEGHALYADTWSDQPPLMTWLLRGWMDLTGWTVQQGRLLVLACATVLLWSLGRTVRDTAGRAAAAAACCLLVVSMGYVRLSVSVMLAIPSLMFAMLSIQAALTSGRRSGRAQAAWLAVSGALLALSALTKLWTLLLLPVGLLAVLVTRPVSSQGTEQTRRPVTALGLWAAGFLITGALLVTLLVPATDAGQLVSPHVDVRSAPLFDGNFASFWRRVGSNGAMVALGVMGLAGALLRRRWIALVPTLWALLAAVVLAGHRPLWYHHALLLAVPLAWGGGYAVSELPAWCRVTWSRLRSKAWWLRSPSWVEDLERGVVVGLLALVVAGLPGFVSTNFGAAAPRSRPLDRYLVALMDAMAGPARSVVTDRQILAFTAGLHVPPALAVTSLKRIHGDHLSLEAFIEAIKTSAPEQIVLSGHRMPLDPTLLAVIDRAYVTVYAEPDGHRVYLLRRLAQTAPQALERAGRLVPECWQGQLNLAYLREAEGRYDDAETAYRRALEHGPSDLAQFTRAPQRHTAEGSVP
jgi:hypothetical protein